MTELFTLVPWSDPILKTPADAFDFSNPPFDPEEFSRRLIDTMIAKNGIGLSSCQVGIPLSAFAVWSSPPVVIFNPKIVDFSEEKTVMEEGCLSFPGLVLSIKRPSFIRLRFTNVKGETLTRKFSGLSSRIIQHENQHVCGITFLSHVSKLKLDMAAKKAKKLGFDYTGIHKCR
jgi:peptide deformylase